MMTALTFFVWTIGAALMLFSGTRHHRRIRWAWRRCRGTRLPGSMARTIVRPQPQFRDAETRVCAERAVDRIFVTDTTLRFHRYGYDPTNTSDF
jgi:hypothetical protein